MHDTPFQGPGDKDLKRMGMPDPWEPDSMFKSTEDSLVRGQGGGGLSKAAQETLEARKQNQPQTESPPETYAFPTVEEETAEDAVKATPAVLSEAKWTQPDTLFHRDAEVSVKLALPQGKEHITKVQVELFAQTPAGPESISKGEGWAQADGTAVITVPVYKPQGHVDGPVEYFFRIMHSLAGMLSGEKQSRHVSEMALKSADHVLVPGIAFERESSFIPPKGARGLKPVEAKFREWDKTYSKKAQLAVFGHADKGEKDAKGLSERRAHSAFAFITQDAAAWEKLYVVEKWGLKALQSLLKDLGHYHGASDGQDGPKTQAGFKAFQKGAGLPESGTEDSGTRKALFAAYMKGKHDIKIDASRFCKVAGNPWMGCAGNNQVKEGREAAPENGRVAFILIVPNKHFPVHFPCRDGNEAACQAQCRKAGKRSAAGIQCAFYDELVREVTPAAAKEPEPPVKPKKDIGYSIEKAVAHLNTNAKQKSIHKCATYVRQAIQAGGGVLPTTLSHEYAKEYGPVLSAMGFQKLSTEGYAPQKGDIAVFQPPLGEDAGHVQMYNGTEWVSDFFQGDSPDIYPGPAYRNGKVNYEIYRP
ncbi:MAG TPA: peptidoglycan-binding protein [Fibrobacteria bacterium]|nr:peptidoglycan-binding protein [Fibrobacteria bacterium]